MPDFQVAPAFTLPLTDLADLFSRAFAHYIAGAVRLDARLLSSLIAKENVDLGLSQIILHQGNPVGFGLIACQGLTSRLAGMGIVPESQGQGVGSHLLAHLLEQARERRETQMVLEAFEQNTPAVKLYQRAGFAVVQRLYGYQADHLPGQTSTGLREGDCYEVAKWLVQWGESDLPWQVAGTTIARLGHPNRAYVLDQAMAVISDPAQDTIHLRCLFVPPPYQKQGQGSRLLRALVAAFPQKRWAIKPLCPERYGTGFFEKRGFIRQPLNQVLMALAL
jgi:ribosomal protein S18 acetylase RimI-like enzyme